MSRGCAPLVVLLWAPHKAKHHHNGHMRRRPTGDVDPSERLAPLAQHLEEHGIAEMREAMVLYGAKDRYTVTRALHRRLDVTLVQTGPVPSSADVVRRRWPRGRPAPPSWNGLAGCLCRSLRTTLTG